MSNVDRYIDLQESSANVDLNWSTVPQGISTEKIYEKLCRNFIDRPLEGTLINELCIRDISNNGVIDVKWIVEADALKHREHRIKRALVVGTMMADPRFATLNVYISGKSSLVDAEIMAWRLAYYRIHYTTMKATLPADCHLPTMMKVQTAWADADKKFDTYKNQQLKQLSTAHHSTNPERERSNSRDHSSDMDDGERYQGAHWSRSSVQKLRIASMVLASLLIIVSGVGLRKSIPPATEGAQTGEMEQPDPEQTGALAEEETGEGTVPRLEDSDTAWWAHLLANSPDRPGKNDIDGDPCESNGSDSDGEDRQLGDGIVVSRADFENWRCGEVGDTDIVELGADGDDSVRCEAADQSCLSPCESNWFADSFLEDDGVRLNLQCVDSPEGNARCLPTEWGSDYSDLVPPGCPTGWRCCVVQGQSQ